MGEMPDLAFLPVLVMAATLLYFLTNDFPGVKKKDPRQVPRIPSWIPSVGHVVGIMRYKLQYYERLRSRYPFPIYSLGLLGKTMYVVSSPELIGSIQRNWKALQFAPFASRFSARIGRSSPQATDIITTNANLEQGDWGLYSETLKGIHAALAPGEGLEHMNRVMIQAVTTSFDGLKTGNGPVRLSLASWLRHEITLAGSEAIYGPGNPLRDPIVEDGFWAFENNLTMLLINFLPAVTARKGHKGRAVCYEAFKRYFTKSEHERGSSLVKARVQVCRKYAISIDDIARFELGGLLAILENTMPATFWMLYYVFSSPSILADLRLELRQILSTTEDSKGTVRRTLDVTAMKEKCPLLISVFHETLRHRSCGVSTREVIQETVLNDEYLLKQGSIIQMPSRVIHTDPGVWGPTVGDFDPRRFLKSNPHRAPPAAFRAFGGGTTLCPGRHFASTEVLSVVAMFVLRYDLGPVCGEWRIPAPKDGNIAAAVMFPGVDVEVDVRARKGFEEGSWAFGLA